MGRRPLTFTERNQRARKIGDVVLFGQKVRDRINRYIESADNLICKLREIEPQNHSYYVEELDFHYTQEHALEIAIKFVQGLREQYVELKDLCKAERSNANVHSFLETFGRLFNYDWYKEEPRCSRTTLGEILSLLKDEKLFPEPKNEKVEAIIERLEEKYAKYTPKSCQNLTGAFYGSLSKSPHSR